jgi:hypothetical protein
MNWKAWLYSIAAGGIGGASSSMLGAFVMPDVFNFTHAGWVHIGKLAFIGAIVPILTYLKQSPLPATTVTTTATATVTKETVKS